MACFHFEFTVKGNLMFTYDEMILMIKVYRYLPRHRPKVLGINRAPQSLKYPWYAMISCNKCSLQGNNDDEKAPLGKFNSASVAGSDIPNEAYLKTSYPDREE